MGWYRARGTCYAITDRRVLAVRGVAALMIQIIGAPGFEPGTFWSQTRRATGLRYAPLALRVSNLTRPAPPSNGVMCKAPCCAAGCAALILTRSYRNGVHNGSSLLADGYVGPSPPPPCAGPLGRRPPGR